MSASHPSTVPDLSACCVVCGRQPTMYRSLVNGIECIGVIPRCGHNAGFHLWPRETLAARSPAPSDVLKHPDSFLVRIERPGGVRFMEATAPTLEEAAEGVGLQRRPAPSVEARDACPFTREDVRQLRTLAEIADGVWDEGPEHEGWKSDELIESIASARLLADKLASLLPPEKT